MKKLQCILSSRDFLFIPLKHDHLFVSGWLICHKKFGLLKIFSIFQRCKRIFVYFKNIHLQLSTQRVSAIWHDWSNKFLSCFWRISIIRSFLSLLQEVEWREVWRSGSQAITQRSRYFSFNQIWTRRRWSAGYPSNWSQWRSLTDSFKFVSKIINTKQYRITTKIKNIYKIIKTPLNKYLYRKKFISYFLSSL